MKHILKLEIESAEGMPTVVTGSHEGRTIIAKSGAKIDEEMFYSSICTSVEKYINEYDYGN